MKPDVLAVDGLIKFFCASSSSGAESWARVKEVVEMAVAWRETECFRPSVPEHDPSWVEDQCDGDNHQMECPVERARQDLMTTMDKLRTA